VQLDIRRPPDKFSGPWPSETLGNSSTPLPSKREGNWWPSSMEVTRRKRATLQHPELSQGLAVCVSDCTLLSNFKQCSNCWQGLLACSSAPAHDVCTSREELFSSAVAPSLYPTTHKTERLLLADQSPPVKALKGVCAAITCRRFNFTQPYE
jgi:hypothetical protein